MTEQLFVEHTLWRKGNQFRVSVLAADDPSGRNPATAAVYGNPQNDCLVRIHSRCVYGEVFQSDDCDCRSQLHTALEMIDEERAGVVIYLDQEGRGEGLRNKARGYVYSQEHHTDTFTSYRALGLPDDSRSYEGAAELLRRLDLTSVRLLTNNPAKVKALQDHGIVAKRESWTVPVSESAQQYLEAKRQHGHMIATAQAD
ncbi:GTP cyclohydrolase II [Lentzea sp. BCCO 10_0061]|uniref:GTP cyclohydrolase II n=1 Tax=Lentzea sokolovensis TaxID=3095429 RepID=A0ABU4UPB0_9PSEU|nr:GTP cyclohydrolase II [Lentzea sp. BCCO 10_0061]MDX8141314.1 GTP cyclohydrolase II [Lentzea sp. BCCO 10_0061]